MNNAICHLKVRVGPAGLQFFNRKTGVNILVDEFKPPLRMWSSAPRQVSIALTNACDLSCLYCYAPKSSATLAFKRVTSWLTELDANGCVSVGFGGGEPTLYPRLTELCFFAAQKTKLAVTITTHAHRLNDYLLDNLVGNIHFIRVSMDGVGSTFESIRGRSFDELIKRIIALSKIVQFGINFVVNSKTIDDLGAAVHLAEDLGASEFLLLPEESVRDLGGIDEETMNVLRTWVFKYRGSIALSISEGHEDGLPTCNPFIAETGLAAFAHIDALGILKRTSYDTSGVKIFKNEVMEAFNKLKAIKQEVI